MLALRARGIARGPRWLWHALRPALPLALSFLSLEVALLMSGTVVTETLFARPGLGRLLVGAILSGDFPVVQGLVLLTASIYTIAHALAEGLSGLIDPRLRTAP
jgi:ABC-type dipeptide/oligopeptide/nickel transport system permease component